MYGDNRLTGVKLSDTALILMSKVPGAAPIKTRLANSMGQAFAEQLYQAFLKDIALKVQVLPVDLQINYTPETVELLPLMDIFGKHCLYLPQSGGDLGQRMQQACQAAFVRGYSRLILIGGDSPDLSVSHLLAAIQALNSYDMSIIPTQDGGYCLIGFTATGFCPSVFELGQWSTDQVYARTCQIAARQQLSLWQGPVWQDIDDDRDLKAFYVRYQDPKPEDSWFADSHSLRLLKAYHQSTKPVLSPKPAPSSVYPKKLPALSCQGLISIVIPVYREPQLRQCLDQVLEQIYPEFEILVIDGEQSGASLEPLQQAQQSQPERYQRVKLVVSPTAGRGPQMNLGANLARGQIVLFLHADTQLPKTALQSIAECLRQNPALIGGAFDLGIAAPGPIYRIIESLSSWRSRCTRLPYGDQALFYQRQRLLELGAFPDWPLMEELGLGQKLRRAGERIAILPERSLTSARRWQHEGWVFTSLRNWTLLGLYFCGVSPHKLARFYK